MAEDRNLRVQETDEPIPEPWELDGPPIRVPDEDDALFAMVLDLCTILRRVGGVAKIAPVTHAENSTRLRLRASSRSDYLAPDPTAPSATSCTPTSAATAGSPTTCGAPHRPTGTCAGGTPRTSGGRSW
jgi:hypothetical protein